MLSGSMTALVTPMHPDGSLDKSAFEHFVAWQIDQGTDALIVLGTTGESVTLTSDEKQWLVEATLRISDGRCPVVVGAGSNATAKSVSLAKQAEAWGADALLVVTPYYNRPTQAGLVAHYRAIADATSLPIILYNVPTRTGCDLLPETVVELSSVPNIVALKEATGDISRVSQIHKEAPNFIILSGDDSTAAESVLQGAKGVISVAGNAAPGLMKELISAALAGDRSLVESLTHRLTPLFEASALSPNPIPIKWLLHQMGFISPGIRLPLMPLESEHHASVLAVMAELV